MDEKQLAEFKSIKWWHKMCLDGIETPGCTDPLPKLARSEFPHDLTGQRVLDIGAWDGWWSFLCETRGASEVVAMDRWPFDTGRRGFDLAKQVLKSNVRPIKMDVHDISVEVLGTFDLIICLGALHHFKSPLLALEKISSVCTDKLILETHLDLPDVQSPACAVYEGFGPYNDPTILWGPNIPCVTAWLHRVGFKDVRVVGGADKVWKGGGNRATFHASK